MPATSPHSDALNAEKLKTQRELTERLQLENAMTRGDILRKSELAKRFAAIADAFVSRLNAATEVPRQARDDLLRDIASWPLAIEETTHAQTRHSGKKEPKKSKSTTTKARRREKRAVQA